MKTDEFQLKYGHPKTFYIREVMHEAAPRILSAAQIAEAVNKLLDISAGDPTRLTHGNCAPSLNRMSDVSRAPKSTAPNRTGEHPQGWRLVPPTCAARQRAEIKKLTKQVSLTAYKLPFSQARDWLKQCLASSTPHNKGEPNRT